MPPPPSSSITAPQISPSIPSLQNPHKSVKFPPAPPPPKPLVKIFLIALFLLFLYLIILYKVYFIVNAPLSFYVEAYTILTSLFLLSRFVLSYFYEDNHKQKYKNRQYPSVTVVISCKNEEDSIAKTIETCLATGYPGKLECIAINDGSTDETLSQMRLSEVLHPNLVKVINFPENRGKREGMAEGVLHAAGEIIVFVDSDSFLDRHSIKTIVEHFLSDPRVGAVSGNTMVENASTNELTRMQSARYGVSYDVFKTSESVFGTVTCCPGCFSAYRKVAILGVLEKWRYQTFLGSRSTFGDDRSLTNFILRNWKVVYCRSAHALTIVPDRYPKFFKQQLRWKKSWIREGINAGRFIWRKNPFAASGFYVNLLIPVIGPIIVFKVFVFDTLIGRGLPFFYIFGVLAMALLFGIYYYLIYPNRYWWYVVMFTFLYTFFLIWQMPYAVIKLRDTRWGTR